MPQLATEKKKPRHNRKPLELVVVENNSHQLPLGVVEYEGLRQGTKMARRKMRALSTQRSVQTNVVSKNLELKASIIQRIVQDEWDFAELKWGQHMHELSEESRLEISYFCHLKLNIDVALIGALFPGMPPKPDLTTFLSMEEQVAKVQGAKTRLEITFEETNPLFDKEFQEDGNP